MEQKKTLWTKNYTTIIAATVLGCIGNVVAGFALSFLVFEETHSTLASALLFSMQMLPGVVLPLLVSPVLDRYPRKPFLVFFDFIFGGLYLLAGLWLKFKEFNYIEYLLVSLVFSVIAFLDEMSYNALFPKLIPEGMEEKGYSVSSMLYPLIATVMTPLAPILYRTIGISNILFIQAGCSICASLLERTIQVEETVTEGTHLSIRQWFGDLNEAVHFLRKEPGLFWLTLYTSVSGGTYNGFESLRVAFFSTRPGFTMQMYSYLTTVELIGRTVGGLKLYSKETPKEKKYARALRIYFFYDVMDALLLYSPFPAMLLNRTVCGYLGIQSGTLRYAAVQRFIPDNMRARLEAFQSVFYLIMASVLSLLIGALGELLPYEGVILIFSILTIVTCLLTIVRNRSSIEKIYLS